MKRSLLLLILVLIGGFRTLLAQEDTIRSLVITEIRLDQKWQAYVEVTNMGNTTLDLGQFTFNTISSWNNWWAPGADREWRYPAGQMLAPGESWTIGVVMDFRENMTKLRPDRFYPYTKKELWYTVDQQVHVNEDGWANGFPSPPSLDSVSPVGAECLYSWGGGGACYLQWRSADGTDSAAVDQVNLVLDGPFSDPNSNPITMARDVAGFAEATNNATLVRKFSVKEGNMDWANAAGNDLAESEWMPIPEQTPSVGQEYDRALFWTVGNHGDYNLDENTLTSKNPDVVVDYANKTISVPWGFRNNDSVMMAMEYKPGVAWHYSFSPEREDSAYVAARNGDELTVYVCGSDLDVAQFAMVVGNPEPGTNIVTPKNSMDLTTMTYNAVRGNPFEVTDGLAMDTLYSIPFGTRMDTLLLYLDKPPLASWEFVTLNNEVRADVKTGDKLKVTAENGSVKEYFIKTEIYVASRDAQLASIRWPDIDEFTYNAFGWKGDTIPNFTSGSNLYTLNVPYYTEGIPHLLVKPVSPNTKIQITRPKSLGGTEADRTMTIVCTAEDDSTQFTYTILFVKEKDPTNLQPWAADPFISQFSNEAQYTNWDNALEYMNPGSGQIDMSHYMLASATPGTSPADVVMSFTDWADRFRKYIPGMSFVDSSDWVVTPGLFKEDLTVNSIVYGGDVFVAASAGVRRFLPSDPLHWNAAQFDVNFRDVVSHPWAEPRSSNWGEPRNGSAVDLWGGNWYLFRIDNDSVYRGLKPATNPQDFTLVDLYGYMDGSDKYSYMNQSQITGVDEPHVKGHKAVHFRKPYVYKGKPEGFSVASKVTNDSSEYYALFSDKHLLEPPYDNWGWGTAQEQVMGWLGTHNMNEVTAYMSFVISTTYLVDEGYRGDDLMIKGVVTGTTVDDFLAGIIKKNEGQVLTVRDASGTVITGSTPVPDGATLEVLSATKESTTAYHIEVTTTGLSKNAILTSDVYEITVAGSVGFISGFDIGTTLKTVVESVNVPTGASWVIYDVYNYFVPFKMLNYDTIEVDVKATDKIFIEVTAQDQKTVVKYQLLPNIGGDLFVVSDIYDVDQAVSVISLVPGSTNVSALLNNLAPAPGASLKLLDKFGFERTSGIIYRDDIVRVTALDGVTTRDYYLVLLGLEEFANYLAYITSDVYMVNQVSLSISKVPLNTEVSTLAGHLVPAPQAIMEVVDGQGAPKANTDLVVTGDMVKVTAANTITVVYYTVELSTGTVSYPAMEIQVYPNPTSGMFQLKGVLPGEQIRVFNVMGEAVLHRIVSSTTETLTLESAPAGIYFVTVEGKGDRVSKVRLIKIN